MGRLSCIVWRGRKSKGARGRGQGDALLALKGRGHKPRDAGAFRSWKRAGTDPPTPEPPERRLPCCSSSETHVRLLTSRMCRNNCVSKPLWLWSLVAAAMEMNMRAKVT